MDLNYPFGDCGSADHPTNAGLRDVRPESAAVADHLGVGNLDELFPWRFRGGESAVCRRVASAGE